jgi:soluble lytic murein transglycosylase-like protein
MNIVLQTVIGACINFYADVYNVPSKILEAIIYVESRGDPSIVSKNGKDVGLMQLRTQYHDVKDPLDPCENIKAGARYLRQVISDCPYKVDYSYVLCYNRGITGASKVKEYSTDEYYKNIKRRILHGNK